MKIRSMAAQKTAQRKIKGLQYDYRFFLWKNMTMIRDAEMQGRYDLALHYAVSLIKYLPKWAKDQFGKKAEELREGLRQCGSRVRAPDFFVKDCKVNKVRQAWAREKLDEFMTDFSLALDEKGYYEMLYRDVSEGISLGLRSQG